MALVPTRPPDAAGGTGQSGGESARQEEYPDLQVR